MDALSILKNCLIMVQGIFDLKQNMDVDDEECDLFFSRVLALNAPLERLNSLPQQSLDSKKVSLIQINDCLLKAQNIINSRPSANDSFVNTVKRIRVSYSSSLKEKLSELNIQLDRCINTMSFCISVDSDCKLDAIASALQAQAQNSLIENQFEKDPIPDDFDDDRSVLGSGAFGVTHRMKNTVDQSLYAVKVIKVKDAEKAGINKGMMIREATTLRDLNHKYLVRYYTSYFSKEGKLFNLVMELVSGGSLDDKIKDQSVTVAMIRQWLVQLADVLSYLHDEKRLLHRDIKPDNILLTVSGSSIKLIDLGMACVYESSLSKMSKAGTQTYSSYEKAHGLPYDGRDDVWGAGCVFGELLTKSRLTERGGSLYEHNNAEVNRRRLSLIEDCMSINNEMGLLLMQMLEVDVFNRITAQVLSLELSRCSASTDYGYSSSVRVTGISSLYSDAHDISSFDPSTSVSVNSMGPPDHVLLNTLLGHSFSVNDLVYDSIEDRLYSTSSDHSIRVWSMSNQTCIATLKENDGVDLLCFNAARGRLYSGCSYKPIQIWDMSNNSCVATLERDTFAYSMICDDINDRLYTGGRSCINVWDMASHACVVTLTGHTNNVYALICDPSRERLYSGSDDNSIKVWDTSSHALVASLCGHSNGVRSLACDANRGRLYSGSRDNSIKVWDMTYHYCLATLIGHSNDVLSLTCNAKSGRLYSGSDDKTIKVWDMTSHACLATLNGHFQHVSSVVCDTNRRRLYSGSLDHSIKVWSI